MSMPEKSTPKISGLLNNCGVYVGVPLILESINYYAQCEKNLGLEEKEEHGINRTEKMNALRTNYNELKEEFTKYYKLNAENFTWIKFNSLLERLKTSDIAIQMILGPVLREVIKNRMIKEKLGMDIVEEYCGIQSHGRYSTLPMGIAYTYLLKLLGIGVKENIKYIGDKKYSPSDEKHEDTTDIAVVSVYNKVDGEHWELLPDEQIANEATEAELKKLQNTFPELANVYENISSSGTKEATEKGLEDLKVFVGSLAENLEKQSVSKPVILDKNKSSDSREVEIQRAPNSQQSIPKWIRQPPLNAALEKKEIAIVNRFLAGVERFVKQLFYGIFYVPLVSIVNLIRQKLSANKIGDAIQKMGELDSYIKQIGDKTREVLYDLQKRLNELNKNNLFDVTIMNEINKSLLSVVDMSEKLNNIMQHRYILDYHKSELQKLLGKESKREEIPLEESGIEMVDGLEKELLQLQKNMNINNSDNARAVQLLVNKALSGIKKLQRGDFLQKTRVNEGNYYKVLGVDSMASKSVITEAYNELRLRFSPDKNPGTHNLSEDKKLAMQMAKWAWKSIEKAYEVLSDSGKREAYDNELVRERGLSRRSHD